MRHVITSVVLVFGVTAHANAQTPSEQLHLQRLAATGGEVVIVADDGGGSVRGKLIEASDSVLELETRSGRRRFDLSRVSRVNHSRDSVVNGVMKGMGIASAWCMLACESDAYGSPRASGYISRLALGGLIGGAIDARINTSRPAYLRRPSPGVHVGVGRPGVSVLVVF
jgi:hypothetical protein